jgi:hypothetical protein
MAQHRPHRLRKAAALPPRRHHLSPLALQQTALQPRLLPSAAARSQPQPAVRLGPHSTLARDPGAWLGQCLTSSAPRLLPNRPRHRLQARAQLAPRRLALPTRRTPCSARVRGLQRRGQVPGARFCAGALRCVACQVTMYVLSALCIRPVGRGLQPTGVQCSSTC